MTPKPMVHELYDQSTGEVLAAQLLTARQAEKRNTAFRSKGLELRWIKKP